MNVPPKKGEGFRLSRTKTPHPKSARITLEPSHSRRGRNCSHRVRGAYSLCPVPALSAMIRNTRCCRYGRARARCRGRSRGSGHGCRNHAGDHVIRQVASRSIARARCDTLVGRRCPVLPATADSSGRRASVGNARSIASAEKIRKACGESTAADSRPGRAADSSGSPPCHRRNAVAQRELGVSYVSSMVPMR